MFSNRRPLCKAINLVLLPGISVLEMEMRDEALFLLIIAANY